MNLPLQKARYGCPACASLTGCLHLCYSFRLDPNGLKKLHVPLLHPSGLICMMLSTLYFGFTAYIMSPLAFLKDPLVWLRAVTMYRGQLTGACSTPRQL